MILITGGAGYIGSHVVLELLRLNYNVLVYDNLKTSTLVNLKSIVKHISRKSYFGFVEGDIRDSSKLNKIFKKFAITKVIHLAGLKSVPNSFNETSEYKSVNETGSRIIFDMAIKYNVQTIVFSSTASIYTPSISGVFVESDPVTPHSSPYAATKLNAERYLKSLKSKDMSVDIIILRYFNPVGLDKSGLLIEESQFTTNLFPVITNAIANDDYVQIYGKDYITIDGTAVRDYVHVSDVAQAHIPLMNQLVLDEDVRIFNIGSDSGYSVRQVIDTFNLHLKSPVKFFYADAREGDAARCIADTTKIFNEVGWRSKYVLEDMVKSSIR